MTREEALAKFQELSGITRPSDPNEQQVFLTINYPVDVSYQDFALYLVASGLVPGDGETPSLEKMKAIVAEMLESDMRTSSNLDKEAQDAIRESIDMYEDQITEENQELYEGLYDALKRAHMTEEELADAKVLDGHVKTTIANIRL